MWKQSIYSAINLSPSSLCATVSHLEIIPPQNVVTNPFIFVKQNSPWSLWYTEESETEIINPSRSCKTWWFCTLSANASWTLCLVSGLSIYTQVNKRSDKDISRKHLLRELLVIARSKTLKTNSCFSCLSLYHLQLHCRKMAQSQNTQ